jgi:hypothetical protein
MQVPRLARTTVTVNERGEPARVALLTQTTTRPSGAAFASWPCANPRAEAPPFRL